MNHLKKLGLGIVLFAFIVNGCSGGGGGGNPAPPTATTKISGSVSGTTIIAVNDAGDIVDSTDTDGTAENAQGNFDFVLESIPIGENVRVFLITGDGVYPMYFDADGDGTPDTNVFNPGSETEISLGFVNTEVAGQIGRAVPENNPVDISGIVSVAANEAIPDRLFNPDTEGLTLAQLLQKGLSAFKNEWFQGARTYFKKAAELAESDTSNDADTARFFYALIRVATLPLDTLSDGNTDDLSHVGDYLDKLGCDTSAARRANGDAQEGMCPDDGEPLPTNSPTGADYQHLLANLVGKEVSGAISNLDAISTSFNFKTVFKNENIEIDHSDVLVLRAGMKGALALILIQDAYDLNIDIDAEIASAPDTIENILARNATMLALQDASKLAEVKVLLIGGVNDTLMAITSIQNEGDDQTDDLVNFLGDPGDTPASLAMEIDTGQVILNDFLRCLNDTTSCVDHQNPFDPTDDVTFTLQPFFLGMVDFNSLLPSFSGNIPSLFNDDGSVAGSIISGADINKDVAPKNGIPDIIDDLNPGGSPPTPS